MDDAGTLTGDMARMRAEGYTIDFFATSDGQLGCRTCDVRQDPASLHIDQTFRYEGESNPDDESILLAISCGCGGRGLYATAYGPSASPEDAAVLQRLV